MHSFSFMEFFFIVMEIFLVDKAEKCRFPFGPLQLWRFRETKGDSGVIGETLCNFYVKSMVSNSFDEARDFPFKIHA